MKNRSAASSTNKKSNTSETRLSNSNVFNNSSLINTKLIESSHTLFKNHKKPEENKHYELSSQIRRSQNKEVEFLRIKNKQLQQKNIRLTQCLVELEAQKRELFQMNKKYVSVVNQYYENQQKRAKENKKPIQTGTQVYRVMEQLERDHRNLSRHCIVMEQEIMNYAKQMKKFHSLKDQLYEANHQSVTQLIEEINELADQSKTLKKQNNQLCYEIQKLKREIEIVNHGKNGRQKEMVATKNELDKMKSVVNTIKQENQDKANQYQSKIYELELKVERLEKQLRENQQQQSIITKSNNFLARKNSNDRMYRSSSTFKEEQISFVTETHKDSDFSKLRSQSIAGRASNKAIAVANNNRSGLKKLLNQERKSLVVK